MKDVTKIALGILLGFVAIGACGLCIAAALTASGVALLSGPLPRRSAVATAPPLLQSPSSASAGTQLPAEDTLSPMHMRFYRLAVDYPPGQWHFAQNQDGLGRLTSIVLPGCTLSDAGVTEIRGEPQGALTLGKIQYNVYQQLQPDQTLRREYLALAGFPIPEGGGFPLLILTSPSATFLECVNAAQLVLGTLHGVPQDIVPPSNWFEPTRPAWSRV